MSKQFDKQFEENLDSNPDSANRVLSITYHRRA